MARTIRSQVPPSSSSTATITLTTTPSSDTQSHLSGTEQTLILKLKPKKKQVSWKEGTVDNEFMNKKSSKKCCIFHKEKSFDEDASDDEDDQGQNFNKDEKDHDHGCCSEADCGGGGH